eukprot:Platyproteum_vivax@DN718_c0_g1_i2.p1
MDYRVCSSESVCVGMSVLIRSQIAQPPICRRGSRRRKLQGRVLDERLDSGRTMFQSASLDLEAMAACISRAGSKDFAVDPITHKSDSPNVNPFIPPDQSSLHYSPPCSFDTKSFDSKSADKSLSSLWSSFSTPEYITNLFFPPQENKEEAERFQHLQAMQNAFYEANEEEAVISPGPFNYMEPPGVLARKMGIAPRPEPTRPVLLKLPTIK